MYRVVVAGGGFGGIGTAIALRRQFAPDELEIVLVDRHTHFMMGLRKTWAVLGIAPLADGRRPLADLPDVQVLIADIQRIDPANRSLVADGRPIGGDALVIALGSRHAMDAVPGLVERGINVWDPEQAERAREELARLDRGRVLVGIFGMPYACPPGPYELALLARGKLDRAIDVTVFGPAPIALPVVGREESAKLEHMLESADVPFLRGRQATEVAAGEVHFADGSTEAFDILLAVPPHQCPPLLVDAGLAERGSWVKPNPRTLETAHDGVYAIGDCTVMPLAGGLALPKAGVIAEQEGTVVADRIAARLRGHEPQTTYSGDVFCYVETGGGKAALAAGSFYSDPPSVTISEPSAEKLAEKQEFERSRLAAWFGH